MTRPLVSNVTVLVRPANHPSPLAGEGRVRGNRCPQTKKPGIAGQLAEGGQPLLGSFYLQKVDSNPNSSPPNARCPDFVCPVGGDLSKMQARTERTRLREEGNVTEKTHSAGETVISER